MALEREVIVRNKEGLHFRPIMRFVDLASKYESRIRVHCQSRDADGRSPMDLLMLVATQGTKVRMVANGNDAQEALNALCALVESGFGEQ